jgi:hypothetical protein
MVGGGLSAVAAKLEPVLIAVRVKALVAIDPHVLEAELTRAICHNRSPSMTAEVTLLPAWHRKIKAGMRRHAFIAVLDVPTARTAQEAARSAETALRKALRQSFGPSLSARITPARTKDEIAAYWCSIRGTPHRP